MSTFTKCALKLDFRKSLKWISVEFHHQNHRNSSSQREFTAGLPLHTFLLSPHIALGLALCLMIARGPLFHSCTVDLIRSLLCTIYTTYISFLQNASSWDLCRLLKEQRKLMLPHSLIQISIILTLQWLFSHWLCSAFAHVVLIWPAAALDLPPYRAWVILVFWFSLLTSESPFPFVLSL